MRNFSFGEYKRRIAAKSGLFLTMISLVVYVVPTIFLIFAASKHSDLILGGTVPVAVITALMCTDGVLLIFASPIYLILYRERGSSRAAKALIILLAGIVIDFCTRIFHPLTFCKYSNFPQWLIFSAAAATLFAVCAKMMINESRGCAYIALSSSVLSCVSILYVTCAEIALIL